MSDPTPNPVPEPPPPQSVPTPAASVPAPSLPPQAPPADTVSNRAEPKPIFDVENDPCPKCGVNLRPGEVVCVKCGFDLRKNKPLSPSVGVEQVDEATLKRATRQAKQAAGEATPAEPGEEFSTPGRGNIQTILIFAAALVASAMILAGIDSEVGGGGVWPTVLRSLLALYKITLATGAGVVALVVVSHISEMKLGRPDLATARILLAFAAFQVIQSITFPGPPLLVHLLMWTVALGAYWLIVKLLFKKPGNVALYLLATHCLLWLVLQGGMSFSRAVYKVEADAKAEAQKTPSTE